MKKVVLSLAIVAAMFVSCKENAAEAEATVDTVVAEEVVVEEVAAPPAPTREEVLLAEIRDLLKK